MRPRQDAPLRRHRPDLAARKSRNHRHLPVKNVTTRLANHLLAMLGMQPDRNLVPHTARRHKDRSFLAKDLAAALCSSRLIVGSSPYTSSPTSASAIALRIAGV